ncbi:PI-PLC domain-containing protein, partial [Solirubrobacter deserti]
GWRAGAIRLGAAVAVVAGLAGLAASVGPRVLTGDAAARAALETWLDPLAVRCWTVCAGALLVTTAAASLWRPPLPGTLVAQARRGFERVPPTGRAIVAIAFGVVALAAPLALLRALVMAAGALGILWGVAALLRRVAPPAARSSPAAGVSAPRHPRRVSPRRAAVAAGAVGVAAAALAFALSTSGAAPVKVGRCNGSAALCDRTLDEVVFLGTHNSMSADGEPGWLFAAQNASIAQQLDDGVRSLLIDTHYGFQTPRGVATDLDHDSKSREKITFELGEAFIETAQRLRSRLGFTGDEPREIFLCHAFCEVGATKAVDALEQVHEFLVEHPEEVLILSIEDDTEPQDTARLIRDSGLIHNVYEGPAGPPWPTLRQLIQHNERVLVLIENQPGDEPWMHRQDTVAQETPYAFATPAELAAPDSCAPNRGGDAGSLLLVNHWVDTSPAPRRSIAGEVNASAFLTERLTRCRHERRLLPTIVAVDFYRDGDAFEVVDTLNGLTS